MVRFAPTRLRAIIAVLVAAGFVGCATKELPPFTGPDPIETIDAYSQEHPVDKTDPNWKTRVPRPPIVEFDLSKKYYWFLTTSEGMLKIELLPKSAPNHVATTIYLTRLGFYDGLTFHRIIPQFMVQGGDPKGDGSGGPGFLYAGEFPRKAKTKHNERGVVSSANRGPRTDGSQFFILFKEQPELDGKHTIFGQVVEGRGTLRTLETFGTKEGKPRKTATIRRAEIWVE
jgi:peptidyl-prolyl cis-trans isomerase B (cyclophilin B)